MYPLRSLFRFVTELLEKTRSALVLLAGADPFVQSPVTLKLLEAGAVDQSQFVVCAFAEDEKKIPAARAAITAVVRRLRKRDARRSEKDPEIRVVMGENGLL